VLCEGRGLPITVAITPGQQHETTMLETLLDDVAIAGKTGRPRKRFAIVAGDKGYDIPRVRQQIEQRGSTPLIPHKKLRDGSYAPGSEEFDKIQYKRRNIVERLIGKLKECRHLAMRFDKLADSFRAFVLLGFIRIWLKDLLSYTA
jgi:transposase